MTDSFTKLHWDIGTGYDLFLSLTALHSPDSFGLRASWAAGVRSRLSGEDRQTLEKVHTLLFPPLFYVHGMKRPKSAEIVIENLENMPASDRLLAITFRYNAPEKLVEILTGTTTKKRWTSTEKTLINEMHQHFGRPLTSNTMDQLYNIWAQREQFGEDYLRALKAYYASFFHEEEHRILPVLKQGLSHAQMRAGSLPLPAMLEELSAGVRLAEVSAYSKLYLVPTFWGTPFLFYEYLDKDTMLILFGARPDSMALVPGEVIPESLLQGLKALSDPTRLRILRSLANTPQSAAQLSRALRLRPPTVAHHLMALRISGMVQVTVNSEGDRQYATRYEGFEATQDLLNRFVRGGNFEN